VLAFCQKRETNHYDIRPSTIFILSDKKVAVSQFGDAKFLGQIAYNKECIPYLAPKLMAQGVCEEAVGEVERSDKDDVYSLGLVMLQLMSAGAIDIMNLNQDSTEVRMRNYTQQLRTRGFSEGLVEIVVKMLRFNETERDTF